MAVINGKKFPTYGWCHSQAPFLCVYVLFGSWLVACLCSNAHSLFFPTNASSFYSFVLLVLSFFLLAMECVISF